MQYPRHIVDTESDGFLADSSVLHCIVAEDTVTGEVLCFHNDQTINPRHGSIQEGIDLLSNSPLVAFHNGLKHDIPIVQRLLGNPNVITWEQCFDTLLMTQILWPDIGVRQDIPKGWQRIPKHLLGSYSLEAWGYRLGTHKIQFEQSFRVFTQEMLDYCVGDVATLSAIVKACYDKGFSEQCFREEHEFAWLMFLQEQHGWRFDEEAAGQLHARLQQRREELLALTVPLRPPKVITMKKPQWYQVDHPDGSFPRYDTIGDLMENWRQFRRDPKETRKSVQSRILPGPPQERREPFNPTSTKQVIEYLQEYLGWKPTVWKKGKNGVKRGVKPKDYARLEADGWHIAMDDEVLSSLPYPETKPLAELFMVKKRLGQLVEGPQALLKQVREGRVHGRVNTAGTATGRCSHSNPNVAQVPAGRAPYGADFRKLFLAEEGWEMVGWDAEQLELRLFAAYVAYYDGGRYARQLVRPGFDAHTYHQNLAGLPTRDDAKTFIYAFLYSAGPGKLGEIIGKGPAAGKRMRENFLKNFEGLDKLITAVQKAAEKGYLKFPDGRHTHVRSAHSALNTLLQGVGALVMKEATRRYIRKLREHGVRVFGIDCPWWDRRQSQYDFALTGQIHDEDDATCRSSVTELASRLGPESLVEAGEHYNLRCRLDGAAKVGKNWYDVH